MSAKAHHGFKPQVSVLLPFRDAAPQLQACVDSVLAQCLEDFELIAVDDGSRDEGPRWLASLACRDRRVRLTR